MAVSICPQIVLPIFGSFAERETFGPDANAASLESRAHNGTKWTVLMILDILDTIARYISGIKKWHGTAGN
jgi:ABC-type transporter lipoprotein component MlaA